MHIAKSTLTDLIILVLFGISGIWNVCIAQKVAKMDSLLGVLQKVKVDTNKVNTLIALSSHLSKKSKLEDAKKYAEEALKLAEKVNYKKGIASAYFNIGIIDYNQANYSEALKYYLVCLKIFDEIGDKKGNANSHQYIGNIYYRQGNYTEALKYYLAALKIFEEIGDKNGIASSYQNIGIIYKMQGNYLDALKYYMVSLKIKEEIGDKSGIAYAYHNIGINYKDQGNYLEALKYYLISIKIKEEIGDKIGIASSYNQIGIIYKEQGNYIEALKYYLNSLKIVEEIGEKNGISNSYIYIGHIYSKQDNYSEALKYYLNSLKIKEEIGDKSGIATTYQSIGNIYYYQENYTKALRYYLNSLKIKEEIGEKSNINTSYINIGNIYTNLGNYNKALNYFNNSLMSAEEKGDKLLIASSKLHLGNLNIKLSKLANAKKYLDEALFLSKELGIKIQIRNVYKILVELDSITGNHQQALEHYKLYTLYKDSLLNESNSKSIAEMKTKYETEKKEKEIQQLESEKVISKLEIEVQQEALHRIKLEKQKILKENLFNLQQVNLLTNERRLQELEIEKNGIEFAMQKAETDSKKDQLVILNKEGDIQKLEIKKQTLMKNYLICGMLLFCALSFFAYNNYSTRQKLKLQTLRNKIASDLHDDVGSTLSSISIFSQIAQQQSKDVIPLLETIGESSRKMLDAMADIVWTINPENDQFEKIILRMRSFAYELLGAKNIGFEFIAGDDISKINLPMDVRKNLYLIFKEATNNMVKYSDANKAKFEIKNESNQISMIIRDNGKGFDLNKSTEGNGLKNMKRRAEEIGAKLSIDTDPGKGTLIQLTIAV